MKETTLCYIEKDEKYLMLHRTKKENDYNHDKWIGVGGKFEEGEGVTECLLREVKEETGLTLTKYKYRGLVTFDSDKWELERMHLFTATEYEGEISVPIWGEEYNDEPFYTCDEGELVWVPKSEVEKLNLWEGDRVFLKLLLEKEEFFKLILRYEGDELVENVLLN